MLEVIAKNFQRCLLVFWEIMIQKLENRFFDFVVLFNCKSLVCSLVLKDLGGNVCLRED